MKLARRLALIAIAAFILISAAVPVFADTIVDYVLSTDIHTVIDGVEIISYNINGYTAVVVEELAYFNFDVKWNAQERRLDVKKNLDKDINYPFALPAWDIKPVVGKKLMPVYATDIKTFLDGKEVQSFNIGGKTIIYVDDLSERFATYYKWDENGRVLWVDFLPQNDAASAPAAAAPAAAAPVYYKNRAVSVNDKVDKSTITANVGHYSDENEKNIFDGDPETKWCTNYKEFGDGKNEIIVEWAMKEAVKVERYVITTANDVDIYPGRNPDIWTLEAKKTRNAKWTVIDTEEGYLLPKKNFTDSLFFKVKAPGEYKYYRLVITDNLESIDTYQFSELKLYKYEKVPVYDNYDSETVSDLLDFMNKYGAETEFGLGYTFYFDDGERVVLGYTEMLDCFFVNVFLPNKNNTEYVEISVWLFTFTTSKLSDVNFTHWSNDEYYDDIVKSATITNLFRGYDCYEGDIEETGLEVFIDGDFEGSGYFKALASYYDVELQPFVDLLTAWGEYTNFVLDLIVPGATIADFGFINFGK